MTRCLRLYIFCANICGCFAQMHPQTSIRATATASDEAHALVGTWRVVEFADLDKEGKWVYLFGEHPRG
jgi:hypothetical protein